jgi:hypothetical protein
MTKRKELYQVHLVEFYWLRYSFEVLIEQQKDRTFSLFLHKEDERMEKDSWSVASL